MQAEIVVKVPIRQIPVVVDIQDSLAPTLSLVDFRSLHGSDPDQHQYRILNIEVITSPDDQQPMLVSECARYSRFLRREGNNIYFRRELDTV
jgi:hypothetical protein